MKKPKFSVAASSTKNPKTTFSRFTRGPYFPSGSSRSQPRADRSASIASQTVSSTRDAGPALVVARDDVPAAPPGGRCARASPRPRPRTPPRRSRLRQSSSVSFHVLQRVGRRAPRSGAAAPARETCIQNLTRIMPSAARVRSNSTISLVRPAPLLLGGEALDPLDEHPAVPGAVEHGHAAPARAAPARSATGSGGASRRRSARRTARPARAAGPAAPTSRLIAPPLPEASQPSKTTHSGGPSRCSPSWPPSSRRRCSSRSPAASRRLAASFFGRLTDRSTSDRRLMGPEPGTAAGAAGSPPGTSRRLPDPWRLPCSSDASADTLVGAIGLGAMPLSVEGRPDEAQAGRHRPRRPRRRA